jgi:hypothetical protein
VVSTNIHGDNGTVVLKTDFATERRYAVVREGRKWLVDGEDEKVSVQRAKTGEPLRYAESFELDGEPIDARLTVTVLSVRVRQAPPYSLTKAGHHWLAMRVRVHSNSSDKLDISVENLQAVTPNGERYRGAGTPFEPSLGNDVATLEPGETLTGVVGVEVARRARIRSVRYPPAASSVGPLIWSVSP